MSELLFASPITTAVTGIILTATALIMWIKGGFQVALYAAAGFVVLTAVMMWLSLSIRTDHEQVNDVLHQVAAAVQRNDLDAVMEYVHPNAKAGINRARSELPRYHFTEARVTGVKKIDIQLDTNPPAALAEFNVAVSLNANGNEANGIRRFVRAYLFKEKDRWLVYDYEHLSIDQGMRNTDP